MTLQTNATLEVRSQPLRPNPALFQTGDLIWPRASEEIVFFRHDHPPGASWLAQRPAESDLEAAQRARLNLFERDIWVGHVGLIDIIDGQPWVIDATTGRSAAPFKSGVAMQPYADFLADAAHVNRHIWHGRFRGLTGSQAQAVAQAAKQYLDRPYGLSPLGFEHTDTFYCSKLIWHAVRDALGVEMPTAASSGWPRWFTPWDLMNFEGVELLYQPAGMSYRASP